MTALSIDQPDLDLCASLQREEWEVLESIYPDCVSNDIKHGIVKLEVPIEFPDPRSIALVDDHTTPFRRTDRFPHGLLHSRTAGLSILSLSTLPPILLDVLLPPTYPYTPPEIVSIHATHSWLPRNLGLHRSLMEKWREGEGVLYTWVEWIRTGDFLDGCGLVSSSEEGTIISIPHPAVHQLNSFLKAYDTSAQLTRFSQNSYSCEICLTSIKGARCILLSCSHVFCRACLEDFWKLCIKEGDVGRVGCPDPGCVKEGREANEEDVRRVVTEEELKRWKWLREKRTLEKDPTLIHCPLSFCQHPVAKPQNVEEGSGWERLRTCLECGFSFCAYCRRTWHGPLSECTIASSDSLVSRYMELPEQSPERQLIDRRYGRANLLRLVAKYEEDQANRKWLEQSTMACPTCQVHVEKSIGCNHMTCAKCGTHFCYRCGAKLLAQDPYAHFSRPGQRCYMKLFDIHSEENDWQPVDLFDNM
ncbi:hypothetical protein BKA93DRAFT_733706 [Sparassis latifolia]